MSSFWVFNLAMFWWRVWFVVCAFEIPDCELWLALGGWFGRLFCWDVFRLIGNAGGSFSLSSLCLWSLKGSNLKATYLSFGLDVLDCFVRLWWLAAEMEEDERWPFDNWFERSCTLVEPLLLLFEFECVGWGFLCGGGFLRDGMI